MLFQFLLGFSAKVGGGEKQNVHYSFNSFLDLAASQSATASV